MTLLAKWVHGVSIIAESPDELIIRRRGYGASFLATAGLLLRPHEMWFHVPITTPVIEDGRRPVLKKVFVLQKTVSAYMKSLHIYQGPDLVWWTDSLRITGDHHLGIEWPVSDGSSSNNVFAIANSPEMVLGLGISIGVQFIQPSPPGPSGVPINPEIFFTNIGVDFDVP